MKPDTLQNLSALTLLKHLMVTAEKIELLYGDKSQSSYFLQGIQGRVCRANAVKDGYIYFLGSVEEIRSFLDENCIPKLLAQLRSLLLNIYNRVENRRRMGVELMVIAMLTNRQSLLFEVPEKYHSRAFVMDMLVSCRHRFQKPEKNYSWSQQSQALINATLNTSRRLRILRLALVDDLILKSISVNCKNLDELEIQLSDDVTDDGILSLCGKKSNSLLSKKKRLNLKECFVKDALLITPQTEMEAEIEEDLRISPSGFGCMKLTKIRINGDYILPPLQARFLKIKQFKGPVLERGFYSLLTCLPRLESVAMLGLPTILSRLEQRTTLKTLRLCRDLLYPEEMIQLSENCKDSLEELTNVSKEAFIDEFENELNPPDQHFSLSLCNFIRKFPNLRTFQGRISITCFGDYIRNSNETITDLNLSTDLFDLTDLLTLRKFLPNLVKMKLKLNVVKQECKFGIIHNHDMDRTAGEMNFSLNLCKIKSHFAPQLLDILKEVPMKKLESLELEGNLTLLPVQLLTGNCEAMNEIHLTNSPNNSASQDNIMSDEWIDAFTFVSGRMQHLDKLVFQLDAEQPVESGSFTEAALIRLLDRCVTHYPKVVEIVGEFTRIPDLRMAAILDTYKKGLKNLINVRNALPYRKFENPFDSERAYSVNEGFQRQLQLHQEQHQQQQQLQHPQQQQPNIRHKRFNGYVFRPF